MKLVHIADTHLGLAAFSRLDPDSGMNLREKQIYENFLAAIDVIIREKPDVLVHAGDLFDVVKPKTRAYTTVLDALTRLHDAGIPLVIVTGNHSMTKTRYTTSPLSLLDYYSAEIHAAYKFRYERVEIGDTIFHLIPNMLRVEDYRTAYDRVELASGKNNVLVTHGLATTIKDKRLATVAEHELDSTILSDNFDYIALGHYHNQSQVATRAWYSGSTEYLTYGEIRDTKGGLVVDPGRRTVEHLDLPKTPMYDCGTVACAGRHVHEITEEIIERVEKKRPEKYSLAQVTLDGMSREHGKGIDMKALAGIRENLLDLKIREKARDGDTPVLPQQDIRMIDYLQEFEGFVTKHQLSERQKAFVLLHGREILASAMDEHRGSVE
ncbi:metallophosphoesterase family protein [Methanoregula sp.]|uniref:metallophosphoesterase family protein n=1 Tax=Methanoregula sp. TaxID=2052170 RepID=UPI002CF3BFEF|nr:metallophosphoesterase [Methanoregula sp.]HVP97630.1 metallophosphoesterase [Methanoregula sp.]